jgi:hypothetical protein
MRFRCKNSQGQISWHDVPCKQVAETTVVQPARVMLDWQAIEGHGLWVLVLLAISVCCLIIASLGHKWLQRKDKAEAWRRTIAATQQLHNQSDGDTTALPSKTH